MPFVDEKVKFLYKSKGDYIYNFKTGKYDHLSDTPIRGRYLQFFKSKNVYLSSHKQLWTTKFFTVAWTKSMMAKTV